MGEIWVRTHHVVHEKLHLGSFHEDARFHARREVVALWMSGMDHANSQMCSGYHRPLVGPHLRWMMYNHTLDDSKTLQLRMMGLDGRNTMY